MQNNRQSSENFPSVHVVLACDDAYAPHAAVTVASALHFAKCPSALNFHLLQDGGLSQKAQLSLSQTASSGGGTLTFVRIGSDVFKGLPLNREHISQATYYRLGMHKALDPGIRKVIYLDSDIVVTDCLLDLWEIDLGGHVLGACADEGGQTQAKRLGIDHSHAYFNAGVAVFDLKALRIMEFDKVAARTYEENRNSIELQDQDILNLAFAGKYQQVPLRWNVNSRIFTGSDLEPSYTAQEAWEAAHDPGILHFTDRRKPWMRDCLNPMAQLYWTFRNQTPWREGIFGPMKRHLQRGLRSRFSKSQRRLDAFHRDLS